MSLGGGRLLVGCEGWSLQRGPQALVLDLSTVLLRTSMTLPRWLALLELVLLAGSESGSAS